MKKNLKLIIFLSAQFAIVIAIVLIILFAGKKQYTVTFNVNGGNHISGDLVQSVRYGHAATPPVVTKDGCYLLCWSADYNIVTEDIEIYAVWEYQTSFGVEFEIVGNSDYCLVSGCYEYVAGDVYIGSFYQGKKVLGIKDGAFKDCKNITGIYLLDGIVSIGNNAFSGCTSLKNIVISSTVNLIGENALLGCDQLEKLSIPFIGNSFVSNTKPFLGYLFGGTKFSNGHKMVPISLKEVTITFSYEIPSFAFYKCSNVEQVNIVGKTEKIGSNAFRNCKGLKYVNIPDSIINIESAAFANCSELVEIKLPLSLESLEEAVFANCINLENVTIGSNLKEIAFNAFQNCIKLNKFIINDNSNFIFENNKLFILKDGKKDEYSIIIEEYKDETDEILDTLPPFIGPVIRPGFNKNDSVTDEETSDEKDLFPVE